MPLQEKPYSSLKYRHEWYRLSSSAGMKQKLGAKKTKQIWTFGAKSGLGRDQLMQLGVECLRKLDAGEGEAVVREWVVGQCKDLAVES